MSRRWLRKIHRWLGLVAGVQLLAWTVSGLYFTVIPIDEIRGQHLLKASGAPKAKVGNLELLSLNELVAIHPDLSRTTFSDVELIEVLGNPYYMINGSRFDARDGKLLGIVSNETAIQIVRDRTEREIDSSEWLESVPVDHEYRGGDLPAWRITLAGDEQAAVYVSASNGAIRAVRTEAWRWFDFLWSLHIMDYEEREDFNHLLIQSLAILGLITVLSGLVLFVVTLRLPKR